MADDNTGDELDDEFDDDELDGAAPERPESVLARWNNLVGYACAALTLMGILLFTLSVPRVVDPEGWICTYSRTSIDAANDDDEPWNDVEIGDAASADDLQCDEAAALATAIPTSEDGDDTVVVPSTTASRNSGLVASVLALLQVAGGVGTAMTRSRVFRRMAITAAIVGLIAPVLGLISLPLIAFVVWGLVFSGPAKSIWGEVRFLGGSRRSPSE